MKVSEVVEKLDERSCVVCNSCLRKVDIGIIPQDKVPKRQYYFSEIYRCRICRKIRNINYC